MSLFNPIMEKCEARDVMEIIYVYAGSWAFDFFLGILSGWPPCPPLHLSSVKIGTPYLGEDW